MREKDARGGDTALWHNGLNSTELSAQVLWYTEIKALKVYFCLKCCLHLLLLGNNVGAACLPAKWNFLLLEIIKVIFRGAFYANWLDFHLLMTNFFFFVFFNICFCWSFLVFILLASQFCWQLFLVAADSNALLLLLLRVLLLPLLKCGNGFCIANWQHNKSLLTKVGKNVCIAFVFYPYRGC